MDSQQRYEARLGSAGENTTSIDLRKTYIVIQINKTPARHLRVQRCYKLRNSINYGYCITQNLFTFFPCFLFLCFSPDFVPIGPRFSNLVLQALLVLFKKPPPRVSTDFIDASCNTGHRQGAAPLCQKIHHSPWLLWRTLHHTLFIDI